ncbi:PD-(D/E)XK nuclease family protein [Erysipelotrichaceae bacterium OttesenSCG-928-M19]|nr:PD-(D/E)XK nuclease family protein [Erysipelotrichaceae bacterium OttesenSCG-928-M19]
MLSAIVKQLDPSENTLLIVPYKYHNQLYSELLKDNNIIFNLSLLDINSFCANLLTDNQIDFYDETTMIKKINIHKQLKRIKNPLHSSLNYLNELFLLEQECNLSNIELTNDYNQCLTTKQLDLDNLHCLYGKIIILTTEDFYPLHYEIINKLATKISYLDKPQAQQQLIHEHNNIIKMLDYVIYEIYENYDDNKTVLLLCDNLYQQDYLINKFNELKLPLNALINEKSNDIYLLSSLFALLNNDYTDFDFNNVKRNFKEQIARFFSLEKNNYHLYLEQLYEILVDSQLFDISFLNILFKDLYLIDDLDLSLLNKLLFQTLQPQLTNKISFNNAAITLASTDFNALFFDKVYILDASLTTFKAKKTSYLLNYQQRKKINPTLITNVYYNEQHQDAQQRLLNCGRVVKIHYSLLDSDNKSQELAYFIKMALAHPNSNDYPLENNHDFYHLLSKKIISEYIPTNSGKIALNTTTLANKLNDKITLSSSALDTFFNCPYQYYVSYLLKPQSNQSFDALSLGNIYHSLIEKINDLLLENDGLLNDELHKDLPLLIDGWLDEELQPMLDKQLLEKYQLDNYKDDLKATIKLFIDATIFFSQHSKFKITASELALTSLFDNSYFNDVQLYGRIDALFSYQDKSFILDYKSSERTFSESKFLEGLSNQLIVYLYLLQQNNYNYVGAFFKSIKDDYVTSNNIIDFENNKQLHLTKNKLNGILLDNFNITDFDSAFLEGSDSIIANLKLKKIQTKEQLDEYFKILENHFETLLQALKTGEFLIEPYSEASCQYCNYKVICKYHNNLVKEQDDE